MENIDENLNPQNDEILQEVSVEETEKASGEVIEDGKDFEKELTQAVDKYQRIAAEYYNYRERTTKEKAAMYGNGIADTVEKLLPVVDNLERAVAAAKKSEENENDSFIKGVEMVLKQFMEILNSMGVEEIPAVGERFDPNLHSAVSHIQDENFGENTISLEMIKGYKYKEKVIRHSMVQVAN